jgi:hypothetical protein
MEQTEYKYMCVQCEFYTNIKPVYEKHLRTEKHKTGKRGTRCDKKYPEKCENCEYKPKSNRNYIQHKLIYHSTKEEKKEKFPYYCEKCNFGTYSELLYNKHNNSKKHIMTID